MSISLYDLSIIVLPDSTQSFLIELVESVQKCRLLSTYCRVELVVWNNIAINESITSQLNENLHIKQVTPALESNDLQPVYHGLNQTDGNTVIMIGDNVLVNTSTLYKHYVLHHNLKETILFPTFVGQKNKVFYIPSIFSFSKKLFFQTGIHLFQTKFPDVSIIPYLHYLLQNGIKLTLDKSSPQTIKMDDFENQQFETIQQLNDLNGKNFLVPIDSTQKSCQYERYPLQYEW